MLWIILALGLVLGWAVWGLVALLALEKSIKVPSFLGWLRELGDQITRQIIIFAVIGILITVLSYIFLYGLIAPTTLLSEFLSNAISEFASIAITVGVLDKLYAKRAARQEKDRIIRQMASHSNDFALDAVRQIRGNGWDIDESICRGDFYQGNLRGAFLRRADLKMANLRYANLKEADLESANLEEADLSYANLEGVNLSDANLEGADLSYANLEEADLSYANLEEADLSYANLEGADLSYANLEEAAYTAKTAWPEDFDPKASGAIEVEYNNELGEFVPVEQIV